MWFCLFCGFLGLGGFFLGGGVFFVGGAGVLRGFVDLFGCALAVRVSVFWGGLAIFVVPDGIILGNLRPS